MGSAPRRCTTPGPAGGWSGLAGVARQRGTSAPPGSEGWTTAGYQGRRPPTGIGSPLGVAGAGGGGDALAEGAEALAHRLPDRLERLEPVGAAAGVDADALGRAVVDRHEHGRLALA